MPDFTDSLMAKLREMADQFAKIEADLADPEVLGDHEQVRALSMKRAALADLVERYHTIEDLRQQVDEHQQIIDAGEDDELVDLARSELPAMREKLDADIEAIANELVTAEDRTVGSVMLELRAGAGGAEAALWAGDLLAMYQAYAQRKGWSFEPLEMSAGEQGGVRQAVIHVQGDGVWQGLGYDSGVHCVKRVPATEAQGRVHTSTATAAVLPEPEKVQIDIPADDVRIDVTTAQGPGGQNVNKVATAVHMIHLPTGIEVRMQESKSQAQNREKAWKLMRARVYDHFQREKDAERAASRSAMIGRGERSERIRTYRYKENIVVDHRVGESYSLQQVLAGDLDAIIDALIARDRAQRLAAL